MIMKDHRIRLAALAAAFATAAAAAASSNFAIGGGSFSHPAAEVQLHNQQPSSLGLGFGFGWRQQRHHHQQRQHEQQQQLSSSSSALVEVLATTDADVDNDDELHVASAVDYCDNPKQLDVLKHHYNVEFTHCPHGGSGNEDVAAEVKQDYVGDDDDNNLVIHKLMDNMPTTYRGCDASIHAWKDLVLSLEDGNHEGIHLDIQHVKICQNHAQVIWKAEQASCEGNTSPKHPNIIYGTDSYIFDNNNHIRKQTIVAVSQKE